MSVLRPLAAAQLKNSSHKNRVWSDDYESWGFFGERVTNFDEFLLWCSVSPGDRLTLDPSNNIKDFFTVVGVWQDKEEKEVPVWIFRLMGSNYNFLDVKVKEKNLFTEAIKYL